MTDTYIGFSYKKGATSRFKFKYNRVKKTTYDKVTWNGKKKQYFKWAH